MFAIRTYCSGGYRGVAIVLDETPLKNSANLFTISVGDYLFTICVGDKITKTYIILELFLLATIITFKITENAIIMFKCVKCL